MSGNFIQRGEPAIVDKWARTEMALFSGVDLVIELPIAYAMSSAEFFAYGAVKILDSLGIIDKICFGSEAGSIEMLDEIAEILISEPEEYKTLLRSCLANGLSFPASRESALSEYLKTKITSCTDIDAVIDKSNNILGIEYLKALKKLDSKIKPYTIKRTENAHNSEELEGCISSATSIRKQIMSSCRYDDINSLQILDEVIPIQSLKILKREFELGRGPVFDYDFEGIILSILREMDNSEIAEFSNISEGLENRIKSAAEISGSLEELIGNINTRRYTVTRIQRCLFGMLTGLKSREFAEFNFFGGPQYARILGFNNTGRQLLSQINEKSLLPVIIKTADFKNSCNPLLSRMLQLESASTDQYVLSFRNKDMRKSGQEYTRNVIRHL
jgi:Predicted nucleotidyltransferase